jgi:hypothetical protein
MKAITTIGPNGGQHTYKSATTAARALGGNGTDSKRITIGRRCSEGGGYVGNVWVEYAK